MMTSSSAQAKASAAYRKRSVKQLNISLNASTDRDIIEWLDSIGEGRAAYVRRLIREDINRLERHPSAP